MQINTRTIGAEAEDKAAEYMASNGYTILERNWYYKHEEIDLICQNNSELVIVEVKYRGKNNLQSPSESVTRKKQKHLISAANAYILEKGIEKFVRFDIIAVYHNKIKHIPDAFYPTL